MDLFFLLTMAGDFHKILVMKALVTGGTGFIGSHLIEFLLGKGFEIFALVRDTRNLKWLKGLNINPLRGDLLSIPSLPSGINTVIHAAGLTKALYVADYYTVNQQGTASLFQALRSQRVFPENFICLSSLAAAGPCINGNPVRESDAPRPITPYGESKLRGEEEALKFKDVFQVVILRVCAVFGPRDKDFLHFFKWINRGILPSLGSKQRFLSVCYVKDLLKALYFCIQKEPGSGEIFNIANRSPCSWDEFGKTAGQMMGKSLKRVNIPLSAAYLAAFLSEIRGKISKTPTPINRYKLKEMKQRHWVSNTEKAEEKLAFYPQYSLQEAIRETVDWYFKQGWM